MKVVISIVVAVSLIVEGFAFSHDGFGYNYFSRTNTKVNNFHHFLSSRECISQNSFVCFSRM